MSEYEKLLERMQAMTDEALQQMVYVEFDDYTDVAIEAAREVIRERGIEKSMIEQKTHDDQLEALVTFQDYLAVADIKVIESKLYTLFKESEENVNKLVKVYNSLLVTKGSGNTEVFLFLAQTKEDFSGGYPFDVFGLEAGEEEYFGLEMYAWEDWVSLIVFEKSKDFIFKLGIDEFVTLCLRKMTTYGYTESEVETKISEIMESTMAFED